jgi:hypothetical protein
MLIAYPASHDSSLDSPEILEKTLKAKFKHTIIHRASRIPRWTGSKKTFVEEKDIYLTEKPPVSVLHKEDIPVRDGKSAFAKFKYALRKVSQIPRPRRVQPKFSLSSPSGTDTSTNFDPSDRLGVFITTRVETDFFNEEDLLAIMNPIIQEPETTALRDVPTLPRDEPFPFTRRFSYRPGFRRAAPINMSVEAPFSTPVVGVATEDVCVDDLAQPAGLSTDQSLQRVTPAEIIAEPLVIQVAHQQDVLPEATVEPAMVTFPILFNHNSPKFISPASASSSSLSTSIKPEVEPLSSTTSSPASPISPLDQLKKAEISVDDSDAFAASTSSFSLSTSDKSEVEPVSSATGSPVSPIPTLDQPKKAEISVDDLDSDSNHSVNHFKRINTSRKNYPGLESWYNKIITELKRANELSRSSVTTASPGNQNDVDDTAADRGTLEASEDSICNSNLELSSVAAGVLCDPKSLSADHAPRVSSIVNGVRQAGFKSAVEGLESSHFLSLLEKAICVSSATSTGSSEGEESPSVRAARNSRVRGGAQGKYAPPPPPPFKDSSFFEEMRARARHAAVYRGTSAHFQELGVSPTPHRARRGAGYRPVAPPSPLDTMNVRRPRRRTVLSAEPPTWGSSARSYQNPALAVANSSEAHSGARHASLPDFSTTPSSSIPPNSRIYDIHIAPTIYPSISGTPRPSMIPRHVSLQRREWASAAQLAVFALAPSPLGLPLRADPRPSMIPRCASLRQGGA